MNITQQNLYLLLPLKMSWLASMLAEDGTPLITGLPSYILLKDDSVTIVSGLEGLDLMYRLMALDR